MIEIGDATALLVITIWVVLFYGDPDLHDALLMWLMEKSQ